MLLTPKIQCNRIMLFSKKSQELLLRLDSLCYKQRNGPELKGV